MSNLYVRHSTFTLEEVLPLIPMPGSGKNLYANYSGKVVRMDRLKYQTFVKSGTVCSGCGLLGEFFALETHHSRDSSSQYHLNLYGLRNKEEVLFTRDHIIPRGKGGRDVLENLQTMCATCNTLKGNYISACGTAADPKIIFKLHYDEVMLRTGQIISKICDKLRNIRESGRKLEENLSGERKDFLSRRRKYQIKKNILKARLKKIEQLRQRLVNAKRQFC